MRRGGGAWCSGSGSSSSSWAGCGGRAREREAQAIGANRTSRDVGSGSVNASRRSPSGDRGAILLARRLTDHLSVTLYDRERSSTSPPRARQRARWRSSPFLVHSALRSASVITRERSAWARSRLSYSGRKRGGAGVSGSGSGASGRSNSSRPCFVAEGAELVSQRSTASRSPGESDHSARPHVGRSEGAEVAHDHPSGERSSESGRRATLGERRGHGAAASPGAARRHVHQWSRRWIA